ncbi:MAG: LacI family DNA-binding transcriptional regulator, partial [Verrucomicrobiota bacterium]
VLGGKARKYRISERTEDRVLSEAKRIGFTPNQIASSLRLRKTNTIGLVIPDISNIFFATVARCIETEARKRGYFIMLCDSQENPRIEEESIRLLRNRNIDGLIISPVGMIGKSLQAMRDSGFPVVLLDRYFPGLDIPYVTSENHQGAYEATKRLCALGHRRIACIRGLPDSSSSRDRVRGYRDALVEQGIEIDRSLIVGDDFSERCGYLETKLLLQKRKRPTAIFSLGNLTSFGAMRAIKEGGLSVPEDVSLVSFDDHYYSEFLRTPLTAVSQQVDEFGLFAVKLLYDQLDGDAKAVEDGISLPTKFVERASIRDLNSGG